MWISKAHTRCLNRLPAAESQQTFESAAEDKMLLLLLNQSATFWLFWIAIYILPQYGAASRISPATKMTKTMPTTPTSNGRTKSNLGGVVLSMLRELENDGAGFDVNNKFSILLAEFLIKQKVRFSESTRFEEQAFYGILQKLNTLKKQFSDSHYPETQKTVLGNILQRDVHLIPPVLKKGQIYTHLEYKSLAPVYERLLNTTYPYLNYEQSDICLESVATLDKQCRLPDHCIQILTTDVPAVGYYRAHQILLLYVLMHHRCSANFGTQTDFETLARIHCAQVYREQQIIRGFGIPVYFRDLYLEQMVICGLFGYNEFLNWRNLSDLSAWLSDDGCCYAAQNIYANIQSVEWPSKRANCSCNRHFKSLALVYYVQAMLLLE